ncbi:MAG: hypothetical protein JWM24_529 [Solirubrobacterales bacterium]|nr:hypothetical protein [Solirubrobacterales bacterium]
MRRLILLVLTVFGLPMSGCVSRPLTSTVAPRVEMPAEAARACSLYLLPAAPNRSDLEIGYATRGAQIVACDAARALAVQTHAAEHALEDQVTPKAGPSAR